MVKKVDFIMSYIVRKIKLKEEKSGADHHSYIKKSLRITSLFRQLGGQSRR